MISRKLNRKQRGVLLGMAIGAAVTALVLACPPRWFGVSVPTDLAARLRMALRADAIAMLWLLAAIANVARKRFFSPLDIDGAGLAPASARIEVDVAVAQNTLEQVVLASVLYPALACLVRPDDAAIIPQLLGLFCLGRLAFWIGYRFGAPWRAVGFALTFYPTVFGYCLVALDLIRHAPG